MAKKPQNKLAVVKAFSFLISLWILLLAVYPVRHPSFGHQERQHDGDHNREHGEQGRVRLLALLHRPAGVDPVARR